MSPVMFVLLFTVTAGSFFWRDPPNAVSGFSMTLLHTGDLASQTVAVDSYDNPCTLSYNSSAGEYTYTGSAPPCVGGMPRLKTVIEAVRASATVPVLLLDSGNMFQSDYDSGSLVFITYGQEAVNYFMGAMAYDAIHFNYREYILGFAPLAQFVANMTDRGVAVVEANLNWATQTQFEDLTIPSYKVFNYSGDLVGYTAGITGDLATRLSYPENTSASDEVAGIRKAVGSMQNMGVNKIVVSVSSPFILSSVLDSVQGIDIVLVPGALYTNDTSTIGFYETIAGPYPTVVAAPWDQPILVVGAGYDGRRLGQLEVTFNSLGVLTSWGGSTVLLDESVANDPDLSANVVERFVTIDALYGKVIGEATDQFAFEQRCLFAQCTIGNWAADGMRWIGNSSIGIFDGAGLRAGFSKGDVTNGNINRTFPYLINYLYTFKLQGTYLLSTLETGLSVLNASSEAALAGTPFLQVSGLNFTYNPSEAEGLRVVDVSVEVTSGQWEPLKLDKAYSIATIDFLRFGGLGFTDMLNHATDSVGPGTRVDYIYEAYIKHITPMAPPTDARISTTSASRRACFASNDSTSDPSTMCSGVGTCRGGKCSCPGGYSGLYCQTGSGSGSGSSSNLTVALAIALPIGLGFLGLLCLGLLLLCLLRRRWQERDEDSWMINASELEMIQPLGEGSFGQVWKASWREQEVAVKMLTSAVCDSKVVRQAFLNEMKIMSQLRHPNVVLFMAASVKPHMSIVMEFMSLGSLFDLLHNELVSMIPHPLKAKMAYQAAKGMHFLHSSGIVHRDLKSLNILLDSKWNVKISDFGLTKLREEKETDITVGSIYWTAPEVLGESPNTDYVLADVYSFGIVLWELLTRDQPYHGSSAAAVAVAVLRDRLRPEVPSQHDAPSDYIELMTACWHQDPVIRPTFLEIMTRLGNEVQPSATASSTSDSSLEHGRRRKNINDSWTLPSGPSPRSSSSGISLLSFANSPSAKPPRGEVAIVFSDVTRAATLWEHDPAAMRDATLLYNEILRGLIHEHRGYEVMTSPLAGDDNDRNDGEGSFCVAFADAVEALEWCTAVQCRLLEADWPEGLLRHPGAGEECGGTDDRVLFRGLRVRMGVDFGSPRSITDPTTRRVSYAGPVVNAAARVTAMAHGGQVLVTAGAYESVRDSDLGQEKGRLRGLGRFKVTDSQEMKLYELKVRNLEARFFGGVSSDTNSTPSGDSSDVTDPPPVQSTVGEDMAFQEDSFLMSANLCRWIIDYRDVQVVGEQIGMGSYGIVYWARWKGVEVALKKFVNQKIDERRMLEFRAEMAFLSELRHPNVVLFIGACVKRPHLSIVTEYMERGDLKRVLYDLGTKLPWKQRLRMLKSAAKGVNYLHTLQPCVVHRDLKPSNLLVDESWRLKVADFGFARIKEENATMTRCGTPCWTAPEVIRGEKYNELADVYSFGVIMWEVLTRKQPYGGRNFMGVSLDVLEGKRPQIPDDCHPKFHKLIKSCWHKHPNKRPSMEHVIEVLDELLGEGPEEGALDTPV